MKTLLQILIQLCLIVPLIGQSNWLLENSKWTYEIGAFTGYGLEKLEVTSGDTLIGNHIYKELLSTVIFVSSDGGVDTFQERLYIFEEDNRLSSWDENGGEFLYDFNLSVGDTLHHMRFGGFSPSVFIVDSIGTMEINGLQLAFQDIRFEDLFDPGEFNEIRVIERIGSLNYHFLHSRLVIQPFDFPSFQLRCYEDSQIELVNVSNNQTDCDYIDGITNTIETNGINTSVYPNPSNDFVIVSNVVNDINKIIVADILGTIQIVDYKINQGNAQVDIHKLNNGIYFIVGLSKPGELLFAERITKCSN